MTHMINNLEDALKALDAVRDQLDNALTSGDARAANVLLSEIQALCATIDLARTRQPLRPLNKNASGTSRPSAI